LPDFRRARMGERRAQFQFADNVARLAAQRDQARGARAGFDGIAVAARGAAVIHSGHSPWLFVDSSSSSL
jgi:hypothetical protein